MQTLVLDTSYRPLGVISWEKAFTLYFKNKVEIDSRTAIFLLCDRRVSFFLQMPKTEQNGLVLLNEPTHGQPHNR